MNKIHKFIIILSYIFLLSYSLTGCSSKDNSDKIEPTSIYNPLPNDISDIIDEANKEETQEKEEIPFECKVIEYEVFLAINSIRKENNLDELTWDEKLYKHILTRTDELSSKFSHTRPDGTSCFSLYDDFHGENIATGYKTSEAVINGWMNSNGHKENILNNKYKQTAIGFSEKNSGTYWCQGFSY